MEQRVQIDEDPILDELREKYPHVIFELSYIQSPAGSNSQKLFYIKAKVKINKQYLYASAYSKPGVRDKIIGQLHKHSIFSRPPVQE